MNVEQQIGGTFEAFAEEAAPRLRHALVARFGPEVGVDAATEALLYAWHNWERVAAMTNPIGYLYRGEVPCSDPAEYRCRPSTMGVR